MRSKPWHCLAVALCALSAGARADSAPQADLCGLAFSRDISTVEWDGKPVGLDEPRFGRPAAVPVLTEPWQEHFAIPMNTSEILAAGRDATGTQDIFVVRGAESGTNMSALGVWTVNSDGTNPTAATWTVSGIRGFDLVNDFGLAGWGFVSDPGDPGDKRAIAIKDALVYQGVVYLFFSEQRLITGVWRNAAFAVVRGMYDSETRSIEWSMAFDDYDHFGTASAQGSNSEPGATGVIRGEDWSISGPWTPYDRLNTSPLVSHVCVVDYVPRGLGPPSDGRVFAERLTRENAGEPWSPAGALAFEWSDIIPEDGGFFDHIHAAALLEWTDPDTGRRGLQILISAGDTPYKNRNIRLTWVGPEGYDPTDPAAMAAEPSWRAIENWTVSAEYHGAGTAGTRDALVAPFGLVANQWIGLTQGRTEGTALVGSDNGTNPVLLLDASDFTAEHPVFRTLTAPSIRNGSMNALEMRCADPADGSSLWNCSHASASTLSPPLYPSRQMFTTDWGDTWQIAPAGSRAIIGNRVFRTYFGNVERSTLPPTHPVRPLQIAPGRANLAGTLGHGTGASYATPQGMTVTRIKRASDGHFYDGLDGHPNARLADPPCATDVISKFVGDRTYQDNGGVDNIANWDYSTFITMRTNVASLQNPNATPRHAVARVHTLTSTASGTGGRVHVN
ncbi:MAG: hypothetical protein DHS20C14_13220 [Phycisphaeraceae bacterium]|nr:MAG: hypothetical protein DHS20C14_13220 [Phycisphaeraceae bacterium]